MADKDELIRQVAEQVRALGGDGITPQQEEWIKNYVSAELAAAGDVRGAKPEPRPVDEDKLLAGTVYDRLTYLHRGKQVKYSIGDVEMAHDLMVAAKAHRGTLPGPNETTRRIVEAARKARSMDTAESGFGSQLVPDAVYLPEIWEAAREDYGRILGLLPTCQMKGPIEKHPVLGNIPKMILAAQTTDAIGTATAYGTQKVGSQEVTLTSFKLLTHYQYSGEMVEDSVVPFVPLLKRAAAIAAADTADSVILNGDDTNAGTGNINLVDANPADTLHYLAADGIRHAALVDNTNNRTDHAGAGLTYEAMLKLPTLMIDRTYQTHWGRPADPNNLVYVITPELDDDVMGLAEVTNAAAGQGKLPDAFAPLNGELLRLGKHPVISTINMGLTDGDGTISTTAGNNVKGQVVCFNPNGLMWGIRRDATMTTDYRPEYDLWIVTLSTRNALGRFTPTGAASGIEWAAVLYDIANN